MATGHFHYMGCGLIGDVGVGIVNGGGGSNVCG